MRKIKENRGRLALYIVIWFGFVSLLFYYSWWLTPERLASPFLLLGLACAIVYGLVQLSGNWILYLAARKYRLYRTSSYSHRLTVDVFVTAYDEDVDLIETCLRAARDMHGEHRTWLLDDSQRPELKALADQLSVNYLDRVENIYHKAGNINAALKKTTGDIIVIFDIDHVPREDFLQRTLGYFDNPEIGFVQVMLTFTYDHDNAASKAASESSLDFYNPASRGADALGSATLVGSNALIRRSALESIGGYRPGLAEDLATSVALHANKWHSVYVNMPLAPGLAPPDLKAWFDQQFKWSRGVFELLLTQYRNHWSDFTSGQRLVYAIRMTYYWIGLVTIVHLLLTIVVLLLGDEQTMIGFRQYLSQAIPLVLATLAIRSVALRNHVDASVKETLENKVYLQWKPLLLVAGTWPAYTLSWFLALLRIPTEFRPTPKVTADRGPSLVWILPQIVVVALLLLGVITKASREDYMQHWLVLSFAVLAAISQIWVVSLALRESLGKRVSSSRAAEDKPVVKDSLRVNQ